MMDPPLPLMPMPAKLNCPEPDPAKVSVLVPRLMEPRSLMVRAEEELLVHDWDDPRTIFT